MVRAYRMPERLRSRLARGAGVVIESCGDVIETARRAAREVIGPSCRLLIAVGDVVCTSLIQAGVTPDACIIDGATLRKRSVGGARMLECVFDRVLRVRNPRSMITVESMECVSECVRSARRGIRCLVLVEGEEDLLALPAVLECRVGECVAYGLPGRGVGVMVVDNGLKELVRETLDEFEPCEYIP